MCSAISVSRESVAVDYRVVDKPDPAEETTLERLFTRSPPPPEPIPARTVVGEDGVWTVESPPEPLDVGRPPERE